MKSRDGSAHIRRTVTRDEQRSVSESSERVPQKVKAAHLGSVRYGAAFTKGLPKFSSVKVEVTVEFPTTPSDAPKQFKAARKFVLDRLKKEVAETMSSLEDSLTE